MSIVNKPNKIIKMFGASHSGGGGGLKPIGHPLGCALDQMGGTRIRLIIY
jgi:hypothetical protein